MSMNPWPSQVTENHTFFPLFFETFGIHSLFAVFTIKVQGEILKTNIAGENTTSLQ